MAEVSQKSREFEGRKSTIGRVENDPKRVSPNLRVSGRTSESTHAPAQDQARRVLPAFDVLVVWALGRFGRSLAKNVEAVVALDEKHVEVVSVREPWLDTAGPTRGLLVSIFSCIAERGSERISERVRAGQTRAKREGKYIGRPRAKLNRDKARELRAKGLSIRETAKKLRASRATVHHVLQDTREYRAEVAS